MPSSENNVEHLNDSQKEGSFLAKSQKIKMDASTSDDEASASTTHKKGLEAITVPFEARSTTKDIFPLPLFTTTVPSVTTSGNHFDVSELNNNFGGIDKLTTVIASTTESAKTTSKKAINTKVKTPNNETFKLVN